MMDAALSLARRFPIFPIWPVLPSRHGDGFICGCGKLNCSSPGKHPIGSLVPSGVKDASQDLRTVKNWWRSRPDANIGIATGAGLVVLDIDPRHGGDATIAELQKKHGRLPQTLTARTGGGGWHAFFACEREISNSAGALGAGLDLRGTGGYVVVPPSLHISGNRYAWRGDPDALLAPMPEWIGTSLATSNRAKTPEEWRSLVCRDIPNGERNDTLARYAGHLLRRRVDPVMALDILQCWNACRCNPPLSIDEVATIVDSICGAELRRRSSANGR